MNVKKFRKWGCALVLAAVLLTGCQRGISIVSDLKETKTYSLPETMIIVATERNRYQEIYTNKIWGVKIDKAGTTFQTYLLSQVRDFLHEVYTMNLLAKKKDVSVDNSEKEQLKKLSEDYFSQLTPGDKAYMGVSQEDVANMYQAYFLANKVVNQLTKGVDLEISDSEAKVITIQQIQCDTQAQAQEAYGKIQEGNGDFAAIAREYSKNPQIERQLGKGEEPGSLSDTAFGLAAGQVSQVFPYQGSFYIIKCISDYNEEATQERKDRMYQQRKRAAFDKIYQQFKKDNPLSFNDEVWKGIRFSSNDQTTTKNFFDLYKKYFPN